LSSDFFFQIPGNYLTFNVLGGLFLVSSV